MSAKRIILQGCDDETHIEADGFSDAELATITKLGRMSEEISTYRCEPVLLIQEKRKENDKWVWRDVR